MRLRRLLKDGKINALTMSYDDGVLEGDRHLIEIFNKYGVKGTFNLNGAKYDKGGIYGDMKDEIRELYRGHEIALHGYHHPFHNRLPREEQIYELQKCKQVLETMTDYPVRGMAYTFGAYNQELIEVLDMLGVKYSRAGKTTDSRYFPEKFTEWHPNFHHHGPILDSLVNMVESKDRRDLAILYVWGHSYELDSPTPKRTWEDMEEFCKKAHEYKDKLWCATNIELYDYWMAMKRIEISYERKMFYNPSNISVWMAIDEVPHELKPGVTIIDWDKA